MSAQPCPVVNPEPLIVDPLVHNPRKRGRNVVPINRDEEGNAKISREKAIAYNLAKKLKRAKASKGNYKLKYTNLKVGAKFNIKQAVAQERQREHRHTDSENSKYNGFNVALKLLGQTYYTTNFSSIETLRKDPYKKEKHKIGTICSRSSAQLATKYIALGAAAKFRPTVDQLCMKLPLEHILEELFSVSGWAERHGVPIVNGVYDEALMREAKPCRIDGTTDGAELTKTGKGFSITGAKLVEPELTHVLSGQAVG
jgi:hypothetical protein